MIEYHVFSGTDGLVVLGTTSESSTLDETEKDELLKHIIKQNNKRMKIVAAVITNITKDAIKKSIKYQIMGADYLLVIPPYYIKTNKEGLFNHFKLIANSVNIPLILYNIPSRCGMNIDIDVIMKLKEITNIVGVKECSKDINHIIEVSRICDDKFSLYCGNDDLSYLFLSLNAKGLINVFGNIYPSRIKNLIFIYDNNPLLALKYFQSLYPLLNELFIETNPIPIKSLMNYIGMDVGLYRPPLQMMDDFLYNNLINTYEIVI